jgi:integrase
VFSFSLDRSTPLTPNKVREAFYRALERAGISKTERVQRNIVFHSGRRFANTLFRFSGLPDPVVQKLTGHGSDELTEAYTDYRAADLRQIESAQERMLKKKSVE